MATLQLTFDLGSHTLTSASIDGRGLGVTEIASVVLARGQAKILSTQGGNLLSEFENPTFDHTTAQLSVAQMFGYSDEDPRS